MYVSKGGSFCNELLTLLFGLDKNGSNSLHDSFVDVILLLSTIALFQIPKPILFTAFQVTENAWQTVLLYRLSKK